MTARWILLSAFAVLALLSANSLHALAVDGGRVEPINGAADHGDLDGALLASPIVSMSPRPLGDGYWMAASDGGVFSFGAAAFMGSMGGVELNQPVVGIAATPSGDGYWLVAADGGVFSFGDASFFGSTGSIQLNEPITAMAASPTGLGYWLVARDGGVFSFGDASFWGSTGGLSLNRPIVAMAATPTGLGYWLMAEDGGVFTFGDAGYHGSAPSTGANGDFVEIVASASGAGYSIVESTGRVLGFGDSPLHRLGACDIDPVVSASEVGVGAVLLRRGQPLPNGGASSTSSTRDSDHIATQLRHAQACQTPLNPALGSLGLPLDSPVVTSSYGVRRHPIWNVSILHAGVDYIGGAGAGAPIRSVKDGVVVAIDQRVAYGTAVAIDHGGRIATVYAHLSRVDVAVGDSVTRGQTIGAMGSTGLVTGAHLHFELRLDGQSIDPTPYLAPVPVFTSTSLP